MPRMAPFLASRTCMPSALRRADSVSGDTGRPGRPPGERCWVPDCLHADEHLALARKPAWHLFELKHLRPAGLVHDNSTHDISPRTLAFWSRHGLVGR